MTTRARKVIDGDALLTEVYETLGRFNSYPSWHARVATTLWVVATHFVNALDYAPRYVATSGQKRSGKTRQMEVFACLAFKPKSTVNTTAASLFREFPEKGSSARPPTLLLDEQDNIFHANPSDNTMQLRGILNAGYKRGEYVSRRDNSNKYTIHFHTFCFAALSGIGNMPDTLTDRSIHVNFQRSRPGTVEKFKKREREELGALKRKIVAWRKSIKEVPADGPEIDLGNDRAEEIWEPLLIVAQLAGPRKLKLAIEAAKVMTANAAKAASEDDIQAKLATDIKTFLETHKNGTYVRSQNLVEWLLELKLSPWNEMEGKSRRLSQHGLSRMLRPFEVRPERVSPPMVKGKREQYRGYKRTDLESFIEMVLDLPAH